MSRLCQKHTANTESYESLKKVEPSESHHLVEEFRQAVSGLPGIQPPRLDSRAGMNQFLKKHQTGKTIDEVVVGLFLRTMQRAVYSAEHAPHFGLGKDDYSHFTYPIRRYPDLFVHQQLFALDSGNSPHSHDDCAAIATRCSGLEENNDQAYYAAFDHLKIRYAAKLRLDEGAENYEAVVTKLVEDGLVVYVPMLGLFGRVPREDLGGRNSTTARKAAECRAEKPAKPSRQATSFTSRSNKPTPPEAPSISNSVDNLEPTVPCRKLGYR